MEKNENNPSRGYLSPVLRQSLKAALKKAREKLDSMSEEERKAFADKAFSE